MSSEQHDAAKKAEAEAKVKAEQDAADAAKAEKAERAEKARLAEEAKTLVKMTKGGETLAVHPTCVAAHTSAGWKVAA